MSARLSERERNIVKATLFLEGIDVVLGFIPDNYLIKPEYGLTMEEMREIRNEVQAPSR